MQYAFGTGTMWGRSLTNSPATPIKLGALQGVDISFEFTTKKLYSDRQFPIAIGRGTGSIPCKASAAQFNAQAFNDLFFGLSNPATGSVRTANAESHTIGEATGNQVTATNNGTYSADLGVVLASDGSVFTRVTSSPVGQQYTCNETTGVYVFNSTQNNTAVAISYKYTDASNGKKIAISNQLLGSSAQFSVNLTETFTVSGATKRFNLELNSCISSKLTLPTKLEDFWMYDFEFEALADASGNIGTMSLDE